MDAYRSRLTCVNLVRLLLLQAYLPKTVDREGSSPGRSPNQGAEQLQPSCAGRQALGRGRDSKSLPCNYLVSWSEPMICVWLLSSGTTQLCHRVFGFFYIYFRSGTWCHFMSLKRFLTLFAQSIFSTTLKPRHKIKGNICCLLESYGLIHIY